MQTTDTLFMVKPVAFEYNSETSVSNAFQTRGKEDNIAELARKEFEAYVSLLKENGISVIEVEDTPVPHTPDSVFPNNWFSTHDDGTLVLYPMAAFNRRRERKPAALEAIRKSFNVKRTVDMTDYEEKGLFLEGTGSLVLDRMNHIAYACLSPRTSKEVLEEFAKALNYRIVSFMAKDEKGQAIYHTNVMMNVGSNMAIICLDSIPDEKEKNDVLNSLKNSGKEILEISFSQMHHFAGNMLEVRNRENEKCLILSQTAYQSLDEKQRNILESKFRLIIPEINTIEKNGGGSARCMVAEIF